MENLAKRLLNLSEESKNNFPPDVLALFDKSIKEIEENDFAKGLNEGDKAPDFDLPNATGMNVKLSEELKKGPAIVTFYRGGWCPYCNMQLRAYQQVLDQIHEAGAQLFAISPQSPDASLDTQDKNDLTFQVLSDVGSKVATNYNLAYRLPNYLINLYKTMGDQLNLPQINADESWTLPVTGTFVIDMNGVIRLAHLDPDFKKRLEPKEIHDVLKQLQK
ncbi:peroxiredoxin-like family protein [Heyndrickxia acidicola]|uniref:thioredoxin-dependent peroxiredoxin n=1 Tax=Heyndrickxia acidicola TaxID=209389 RepID=A0ABU6MKT1_9BACI|nr:peroxiredoxin-like family protein [Heyndrickxia acidicola]MED1205285.1 peroxiredoxin-like family protein [Heyndrickxia acidicola]